LIFLIGMSKKKLNDKDYSFSDGLYTVMKSFMPEDTVAQLEKHWMQNQKPLNMLQDMNPKLYKQLIEDFKSRKKEILEEKSGPRDPNEKADQ